MIEVHLNYESHNIELINVKLIQSINYKKDCEMRLNFHNHTLIICQGNLVNQNIDDLYNEIKLNLSTM